MFKKIIAAAALLGVFTLTGCFNFASNGPVNAIGTYDFSQMHLVQFETPKDGQLMAVVETTEGTIKAVLYPDYAPNTVQNFVNRAKEGYYDGKDIYGIFEKAFFMSGALNKERTQGVTEDGQLIANECSVDLWTFKGAFCSYSGQGGYGDSRFFVIDNKELTEEEITELHGFQNQEGGQLLPDELIDAFVEKGSIAHFAGCYTVFGQTIEGFDVIEKICSEEVDSEKAEPIKPMSIKKITITEYKADEQ